MQTPGQRLDLDEWLATLSEPSNQALLTTLLNKAMKSRRKLVDVATEHYQTVILPQLPPPASCPDPAHDDAVSGAGAPPAEPQEDPLARATGLLETSPGVDPDFRLRIEDFRSLERLARDGHVASMALLGKFQREKSVKIPPDFLDQAQGGEWLRTAAEAGSLEAQVDLAKALDTGEGAWKDADGAVRWYRAAADQGDAASRDRLLEIYWTSGEVAVDPAEVVRLTREAADRGSAEASYRLGRFLRYGEGVDVDPAAAYGWFEKAAAGGEDRAHHHLGEMLFLGEGVNQSYEQAIAHFEQSSTYSSHYYRGVCSRDGLGVPRDDARAHEQFLIAVSPGDLTRGDRRALHALGKMHEARNCDCGYPGIARWYRWAAEKDLPEAQYDLGRLFEEGKEVDRDVDQAVEWYEKASAGGHAPAAQALIRLRGR